MAKRNRWLIFALLALMVAIVAIAMLFANDDDPTSMMTGSRLSAVESDDTPPEGMASGAEGSLADSAITATEQTQSTSSKPRVKDRLVPPAGNPPEIGEDPDAAWNAYIEQTRSVVEDNDAALAEAVSAVSNALANDDSGALDGMIAPDEGAPSGFAADLVATYPTIVQSTPGSNVNVLTNGQVTIYIAYLLVSWEDADIISQHTIPIMFRFVDGEWRLTTLSEAGSDVRFVQSVVL